MGAIVSVTIGLPVPELEAATKWYRQLLGSVEEMDPAPGVREFSLTPTCWLQIFEVDTSEPNPAVLRFESSDIAASHALVLNLATDVGEIESVPGVVAYFEFRDPSGNPLSFYQLLDE